MATTAARTESASQAEARDAISAPSRQPPPRREGPLAPRRGKFTVQLIGAGLTLLALLALTFVAHLVGISHLQYARTQQTALADFRIQLARGEAPVGQMRVEFDSAGVATERVVAAREPVAVLSIPAIDLEAVVFEGTSSGVLQAGPGHRRDTALPGQGGASVIMGRRATYGGPFRDIDLLIPGETITITTGQGEHTYRVIGVRRPGEPIPGPSESAVGRLTLVTADGTPFVPTDAVRVYAELISPVQPAPPRLFGARDLPASDQALAVDTAAWTPLVLWGQALLIAALAVAWVWVRWGGLQAWLIGAPTLVAIGLAVADQAARLLPNLT